VSSPELLGLNDPVYGSGNLRPDLIRRGTNHNMDLRRFEHTDRVDYVGKQGFSTKTMQHLRQG
jgi:hypothetical protein